MLQRASTLSNGFTEFLFFVENEFGVLDDSGDEQWLSTVNVIKLHRKNGKVEVFKYKQTKMSVNKKFLLLEENIVYFSKMKSIVEYNFVEKKVAKFIGCIRDDNDNHQFKRKADSYKDKVLDYIKAIFDLFFTRKRTKAVNIDDKTLRLSDIVEFEE